MKALIQKILGLFGYQIVREKYIHIKYKNSKYGPSFSAILAEEVFKKDKFFFVQVGAMDGVTADPIHKFVKKLDLGGLLIEPQKSMFDSLKTNYRGCNNLFFENVAIDNCDGTRNLYQIKRKYKDLYPFSDGVTSFNREFTFKHFNKNLENKFADPEECIDTVPVRTSSFDTLFNRYEIKHIDLLQIDTEGFDYEVLKFFDFSKFRPQIINYEHRHLSKSDKLASWEMLYQYGYKFFYSIFRHNSYFG